MWQKLIRAGVCLLSAGALSAQSIQVITRPYQQSSQAFGDSTSGQLSADGRWLVFVSDANNLVANDHNGFNFGIFIQEIETGETRLVTRSAGGSSGGNGDSFSSAISSDGRFILLESDASDLVEGDSNEECDVFIWDAEGEGIELISKGLDGEPANGPSGYATFSSDGRFIVFESLASNLAEGDDNEAPDVFHYDRETGVISFATQRHDGTGSAHGPDQKASMGSFFPAVSSDGRYVAFASMASNLVAVMPPPLRGHPPTPHIFVRDMQSQENFLATDQHNFPVQSPTIVFPPQSNLLVFNGKGARFANELFVFDLESRLLSTLPHPFNLTGFSFMENYAEFSVSADGSRIAYNFGKQLFLWDKQTGFNTYMIPMKGELFKWFSSNLMITADGRYVFFLSTAESLTELPTHGLAQLYRYDVDADEITLISRNRAGNAGNAAEPAFPSISADGQVVAWSSLDSDLVEGDDNHRYDVFLAWPSEDKVRLASAAVPGISSATANGSSWLEPGALSWDGRYLVFSSFANDLVPGDENDRRDVFLQDIKTGETTRVSTGPEGQEAGAGSHSAIISGDGRFAAFISYASFSDADANSLADAYVKNLETGAIELASMNIEGTSALGASVQRIAINVDGSRFAFTAGEEHSRQCSIYIRNLPENRTVQGSGTVAPEFGFSSNGRLAAATAAGAILLFESETGAVHLLPHDAGITVLGLNDEGTRLLASALPPDPELLLFDVSDPANVPEPVLITTNGMDGALSPAGEVIAYYENPPDSRQYLHLASAAGGDIASLFPEDGVTFTRMVYPPAFSRDARWFAFSSRSSGIFPEDTNGMGDSFLFDRATGRFSWLSEPPGGGAAAGPSVTPIVSRDGSFVVFQSADPNLVSNDLNTATDIFLQPISRADEDNDGLDDGYETLIFGGSDVTGSGDADGDGFSNAFEIAAATDPLSAGSRLTASAERTSEGPRLRWQAVPGVAYSVQYKDEMTVPWEMLSERIVATDGMVEIADVFDLPDQRFYRIILAE